MNLEARQLPSQREVTQQIIPSSTGEMKTRSMENERLRTARSSIEGAIQFIHDTGSNILYQFFPVQPTLQLQPVGIGGNTFCRDPQRKITDDLILFADKKRPRGVQDDGKGAYQKRNDIHRTLERLSHVNHGRAQKRRFNWKTILENIKGHK